MSMGLLVVLFPLCFFFVMLVSHIGFHTELSFVNNFKVLLELVFWVAK